MPTADLIIICVTIGFVALVFAIMAAFFARVCEWRIMCPAKQNKQQNPPKDAEPADVPDMSIVPGMDDGKPVRAVGA